MSEQMSEHWYSVESGYGIADLWGFSRRDPQEIYDFAESELRMWKDVTIRKDGKVISLDELWQDVCRKLA